MYARHEDRDHDALRQDFQRSLDIALLESAFQMNHATGPKAPSLGQPIGEGFHFQVWKYPAQPLNLAVAIPKQNFLNEDSGLRKSSWLRAMTELKRVKAPLIPPFEILKSFDNESMLLITPFGEGDATTADLHWQPLDVQITATIELLRKRKLFIDDYIQIRCHNGTPFICDLSDLKFIQT